MPLAMLLATLLLLYLLLLSLATVAVPAAAAAAAVDVPLLISNLLMSGKDRVAEELLMLTVVMAELLLLEQKELDEELEFDGEQAAALVATATCQLVAPLLLLFWHVNRH